MALPGQETAPFLLRIADKAVDLDAGAEKAIGSTEVQNKTQVFRNEHRTVLGPELIRELVLK